MDYRKFFKGKKITQMGLGLLGRGIGDVEFLAECGVDLIVTDFKTAEELRPSLKKLCRHLMSTVSTNSVDIRCRQYRCRQYPNLEFVLGGHRFEDFRGRDFILKAAGVPLDSPYIAEARKNGISVEMDASLFFKLMPPGVVFVGVTGTRGKTTTTMLIYEILKGFLEARPQKRGLASPGPKVFLGGNIKDVATLPLLEKVRPGDFVVAELDSWQLQGFGDSKISPQIAVFTTFLSDHLNYYRSPERYFEDKANIFRFQKKGDALVVGEQAAARVLRARPPVPPAIARAGAVPKNWKLQIPGEHNRQNAACAILAARSLRIPDKISRQALFKFAGAPGRLELVREIDGVKIYNDTCATTPDATIAALRALKTPGIRCKNIVLIAGGSDKGLSPAALVAELPKYCKAVVLLPGSGTEKIKNQISKIKISSQSAKSLGAAIRQAAAIAAAGDVILFSPALASFNAFKNEYDRGEQFVKLVKAL